MFTRAYEFDCVGEKSETHPGYKMVLNSTDERHYVEIDGHGKIFDFLSDYRHAVVDGEEVLVSDVVWSTKRKEERHLYQNIMNNVLVGDGHLATFVGNRLRDSILFVLFFVFFYLEMFFYGAGIGDSFLVSLSLSVTVVLLINLRFFGDFAAAIRCLIWMFYDMRKSGKKISYYKDFFIALSKTPYRKARIAKWISCVL